jgi:hypothetical protein
MNVHSRDFNANLYRIAVQARSLTMDLVMNSSPAGLPVDLSALSPAEREQLQAILVKAKQTKQASAMTR